MSTVRPRSIWCAITVALLVGTSACEAPLAPDSTPDRITAPAPDWAAQSDAGIPVHTSVVTVAVFPPLVDRCGDARGVPLTLVGSSLASGLGPYELQYSYCADEGRLFNWEVVLRTAAGELTMVSDPDEIIVLLSDHPDFDIEAHAIWRITGGTGPFEGASGEIQADAFAKFPPPLVVTNLLTGVIKLGRD